MRVMVFMRANHESENGVMPDEKLFAEMGSYNEELVNAGIIQAGEGLHPSSRGVRVRLGAEPVVTNGPFPLNEVVAGFWMWTVKSMDEALEWIKRCPTQPGVVTEVELRPVFEAEDFGAEFTPELREQEERLRAQIAEQKS
jgi:hypothetical protein